MGKNIIVEVPSVHVDYASCGSHRLEVTLELEYMHEKELLDFAINVAGQFSELDLVEQATKLKRLAETVKEYGPGTP